MTAFTFSLAASHKFTFLSIFCLLSYIKLCFVCLRSICLLRETILRLFLALLCLLTDRILIMLSRSSWPVLIFILEHVFFFLYLKSYLIYFIDNFFDNYVLLGGNFGDFEPKAQHLQSPWENHTEEVRIGARLHRSFALKALRKENDTCQVVAIVVAIRLLPPPVYF